MRASTLLSTLPACSRLHPTSTSLHVTRGNAQCLSASWCCIAAPRGRSQESCGRLPGLVTAFSLQTSTSSPVQAVALPSNIKTALDDLLKHTNLPSTTPQRIISTLSEQLGQPVEDYEAAVNAHLVEYIKANLDSVKRSFKEHREKVASSATSAAVQAASVQKSTSATAIPESPAVPASASNPHEPSATHFTSSATDVPSMRTMYASHAAAAPAVPNVPPHSSRRGAVSTPQATASRAALDAAVKRKAELAAGKPQPAGAVRITSALMSTVAVGSHVPAAAAASAPSVLAGDASTKGRNQRSSTTVQATDSTPPLRATSDSASRARSKSSGTEGNVLVAELSDTKRLCVSHYRGRIAVDLRTYYKKDQELLPGKKGISLKLDEWAALRKGIPNIATAIEQEDATFELSLGDKRLVKIGSFRGKLHVSVREYYLSEGSDTLKPGISGLNMDVPEQWDRFVAAMPQVDTVLENAQY